MMATPRGRLECFPGIGKFFARFSKDWKKPRPAFPSLGKTAAFFSRPWKKLRIFFQALEKVPAGSETRSTTNAPVFLADCCRPRGLTRRGRAWLFAAALCCAAAAGAETNLFRRANLVAWCIVPFDAQQRGPEARAAMLERLGLRRLAYDWRPVHVPTFEAEILATKKHGIEFTAFWGQHEQAFQLFEKYHLKPQVWVMLPETNLAQAAHVQLAVQRLLPLVERTRKLGCKLGLYNHGGWGGEPENMVAVAQQLRAQHGATHVGIVYNLHHGHGHLDRFAAALAAMRPYLLCLNLNGMTKDGDKRGLKILPLGQGELDLQLLKTIRDSGYAGPIGILNHTEADAEARLKDNLDGLDWLVAQLDGQPAGPKPQPRSWAPPATDPLRTLRVKLGSPDQIVVWQKALRAKLEKLLKLDDLIASDAQLPFDAKEVGAWDMGAYVAKKLTLRSTPGRTITVILTLPKNGAGPYPAVVCIGGHGSTLYSAYIEGQPFADWSPPPKSSPSIYKGFAAELARQGFVTIATEVSQHEVREPGRTLMGERLWDLMRCVSYLRTLPEINQARIGCGGLSLGGEMTMWLAALDTRIAAADSSGFLTVMDQMEKGHCLCWKLAGLRELVDYADIYALIAPRPLECQNGRKESPGAFTPALAEKAMSEIRPIYASFKKPGNVSLDIHDGGHEIDLPALLAFLNKHLKP
jgi:hypothetical protein